MPQSTSVIVVGAGIAGLACAHRLHAQGVDVLLLEAQPHPGGVITSTSHDGYLFESGPQSFQLTPPIAALVDELSLRDELVTADFNAPRYIVKHGRLEKLPMSPPALLASQLLGVRSRLRIASEPFRRTQPPSEEESIATFVRRKFGNEILEYLVAPFVSGVYAGDPEQLSLKAAFPSLEEWEREYGSIIRGAMKSRKIDRGKSSSSAAPRSTRGPSLCSFRNGMATLTNALAQALGKRAVFGALVTAITPTSDGVAVIATIAAQRESFHARAIIIATPAYIAAQLLAPTAPALAEPLSAIPYAPVAVAAAAYRREQIAHPLFGFGFLVPRAEKIRTLGTVFNSSLFPGRAPADHVALTSFIGGTTDLDAIHFSDAQLSRIAHNDNARLLRISGEPPLTHVTRWPRALPQYNLGHAHVIEAIRAALDTTPSLFLCGNYLEGPALSKCIENGTHAAAAVETFVKAQT